MQSPYGEPVEPEKAPEAVARAVASLPPEQMFELMKQMKVGTRWNRASAYSVGSKTQPVLMLFGQHEFDHNLRTAALDFHLYTTVHICWMLLAFADAEYFAQQMIAVQY